MLASSLVGRGKELRERAMTQHARAESIGTEMVQDQQCAIELEGQLVELGLGTRRSLKSSKR